MATIDELAPSRKWFCGNPNLPFIPVVEAYMADQLDLSSAVERIVKPVNEKYSSGDAGGEPSTESFLWDLWYTILHVSKKTPRTNPPPQSHDKIEDKTAAASLDPSLPSTGHRKLLSLLSALKQQSEPTPPASKPKREAAEDGEEEEDWIFREDAKLWSILLLFNAATREVLNDAPGSGSDYTDLELSAWENVNAFLAHVSRERIADFETMGIFALRHALEQEHKDDTRGKYQATEPRKAEAFVAAGGVWAVILGEELWVRLRQQQQQQQFPATGGEGGKVKARGNAVTADRWKLWIARLRFMSCREDLGVGVRELAAQGAAVMMRVQV